MKAKYSGVKCRVCKVRPAKASGRCNRCHSYYLRNSVERPVDTASTSCGNRPSTVPMQGLEWKSWYLA